MDTQKHAHIQSTQIDRQIDAYTHIYTYIATDIQIHMHTGTLYIHIYMCVQTHALHTCTHTYTHPSEEEGLLHHAVIQKSCMLPSQPFPHLRDLYLSATSPQLFRLQDHMLPQYLRKCSRVWCTHLCSLSTWLI